MSSSRCVAIIQARMASTRLPGKVLLDLAGRPMLAWVVERARQAQTIDEVVVATSNNPEDQAIIDLCEEYGFSSFRGQLNDVLDRYYQCAREFNTDLIVRLTADCPFIDPGLIDITVRAFIEADPPVIFAANRLPMNRTYPIGLDVEVCSMEALEIAWREAKETHHREHVMPYFYEVVGRFPILHLQADEDHGQMRWAVDTIEDLEFVRAVVSRFEGREDFDWREVLALLIREPALQQINLHVKHKSHLDIG